MARYRELQPVPPPPTAQIEQIQRGIAGALRRKMFLPLVAELGIGRNALQNSFDDVIHALQKGRIQHHRGAFEGKFDAATSRELKAMGAVWDVTRGAWKIPVSQVGSDIKAAIASSEGRFLRMAERITARLDLMVPQDIAEAIDVADAFDTTAYRASQSFKANVKKITVAPELTIDDRARMAKEYNDNIQLDIKGWSADEIQKLRKKVAENVRQGVRYEELVALIQRSYGQGLNKARFLARQETNLFTAKFAETRYRAVGFDEYIWRCVTGAPNHPVRPRHKKLDGTKQRWDRPPIVNEKGERKHPKCDFGCRCSAHPVARF